MATFISITAFLFLLVLAIQLRPLWREARGVALGIAVILLVSAILLYRVIGMPQALDAANVKPPETLGDTIVQLRQALERDPNQAENWRLLGMAYQREGKPIESRDAYVKAATLAPGNAGILTEAAQSRALANDKRLFDAQAVTLLQTALKVDAKHQHARWFLGIAQRQAGENAAAATTWEPLLAQVDAVTAATLRKEIDNARLAAGKQPRSGAALTAGALTVNVSLDPDYDASARLRDDTQVFVIAREPGGAPMPVAVEKHAVSELPFTATLDDGDSPMPTRKLSQLHEIELIVRMSQSGIANKQDGDIESKPVRIALPADKPVELVIGN